MNAGGLQSTNQGLLYYNSQHVLVGCHHSWRVQDYYTGDIKDTDLARSHSMNCNYLLGVVVPQQPEQD